MTLLSTPDKHPTAHTHPLCLSKDHKRTSPLAWLLPALQSSLQGQFAVLCSMIQACLQHLQVRLLGRDA